MMVNGNGQNDNVVTVGMKLAGGLKLRLKWL
jgi:hypothetical protein